MSAAVRHLGGLTAALLLADLATPAPAAAVGELKFASAPALPSLPAVALNARAQTVTTTMSSLSVTDTRGTKSGWNVTVQGLSGTGKSAVLAQYCPKVKCGAQAEGYVAGGFSMAANSVTLSSVGASFTGGLGIPPNAPVRHLLQPRQRESRQDRLGNDGGGGRNLDYERLLSDEPETRGG